MKQKLNCKNYGIYVTECKNCNMQYVGQTKNKFSVRWTAHKSNWKNLNLKKNNDKAALLKHYANYHKQILVHKPCISDCFRVIFVERPNKRNLDWCEDRWFSNFDAKINILKIKYFYLKSNNSLFYRLRCLNFEVIQCIFLNLL